MQIDHPLTRQAVINEFEAALATARVTPFHHFQRRHYEAIAEVMRVASRTEATRHEIVNWLADMFAADNPNFKRDRFLAAAQPSIRSKLDQISNRAHTPFVCEGCLRPEAECSADPCQDVIADREAAQ